MTEHRTNKASTRACDTQSLDLLDHEFNGPWKKNLLWLMVMPEARKVQTDGLPDGGPILRRREEEGLLLNSPVVPLCIPVPPVVKICSCAS